MRISLLVLLAFLPVACTQPPDPAFSLPVVEAEPGEQQLLAYPQDKMEVKIDPPGFTWTEHVAAGTYRLLVFKVGMTDRPFLDVRDLSSTVAALDGPLGPGEYSWLVVYSDPSGAPIGRSRERTFTLAPDAPQLPMPLMEDLERQVRDKRPRLLLTSERLETIRLAAAEGRAPLWNEFQDLLKRGLNEPLYPEPAPYKGGEWTTPEWRRIYTPAKVGSSHMVRAALAYQLTGEAPYLEKARSWLLHFSAWNPRGIASHDVTQPDGTEGNDEASMPLLERMSMTYDWIEGRLTEEEKATVHAAITERGNQVLEVLKQQKFLSKPFSNHEGRVLAFLGLAGLSFLGEIPDAEAWLEYVVRCYLTSYPVWGGDDGDWAQGISYWSGYVLWLTEFADALRTATDVDIYRRPFFRNTGYLPVYFHPPYARLGAFGDGGERGPSLGEKLLIGKFATAFRDPVLLWQSEQIRVNEPSERSGWNEWSMEDVHAVLDSGPAGLLPESPNRLPGTRWLRDSGWVAVHSALGDADNDVWLLFKSSRFGSFSHSHADQNSFQLNAFGEPLLIDSGYYPWYGSPHHTLWTRQTRAHNAILINGRGQPPYSMAARGRVEYCEQVGHVTRIRAEAAEAYNVAPSRETVELWEKTLGRPHPSMEPRAKVVRRTVAFVDSPERPWVAVYDYLSTETPTHFQYLLHALETMELAPEAGRISVRSGRARVLVQLVGSPGLEFSQSGRFDVPPDDRYAGAPEQSHFTAQTSEEKSEVKFVAVIVPFREGEPPPLITQSAAGGTIVFQVGSDQLTAWWGAGEVGSLGLEGAQGRLLVESAGTQGKQTVLCE